MARGAGRPILVRQAQPIAMAVLLILGLLPFRYLGFLGFAQGLIEVVASPIASPLVMLGNWLVPGRGDDAIRDRGELERQLDEFRTLYERERALNEQLRRGVEALEAGERVWPELSTRQIFAPVTRASSDPSSAAFRVRAGEARGVVEGAVVTVGGTQLVGVVREVGRLTSVVVPVIDRSTGLIGAVIELDDAGRATVSCTLEPTGAGTLRGDVARAAGGPAAATAADPEPPRPALGQIVRLADPDPGLWPDHAQRLLLGTVEAVERKDVSGVRYVVTVRPAWNLRRLSEVVIRLPLDGDGSTGTDAGPGAGP